MTAGMCDEYDRLACDPVSVGVKTPTGGTVVPAPKPNVHQQCHVSIQYNGAVSMAMVEIHS